LFIVWIGIGSKSEGFYGKKRTGVRFLKVTGMEMGVGLKLRGSGDNICYFLKAAID
jgi:hypothetical protein